MVLVVLSPVIPNEKRYHFATVELDLLVGMLWSLRIETGRSVDAIFFRSGCAHAQGGLAIGACERSQTLIAGYYAEYVKSASIVISHRR